MNASNNNDLKRADLVFFDPITKKEKLVEAHLCAHMFIKNTNLSDLRIYESVGLIYLYMPSALSYQPLKTCDLEIIVYTILCETVGRELIHAQYIRDIVAIFKMDNRISFFGHPSYNPDE